MDSFHSPEAADAPTGGYGTLMQGLMVGFFLPPLMPLFWFREKAHPSGISGGEGEGEEVDDESEWERRRGRGERVQQHDADLDTVWSSGECYHGGV